MAASRQVKAPAVVMIVYGILSEIAGLFITYAAIKSRLTTNMPSPPTDGDERLGYYLGAVVVFGIGFLSIAAAPFIVYGALQMLNGRKYIMARYAALATLLPLSSCLFIVGFPIGAWAMTVLARPDVKASFDDRDGGKTDVP
jgi:predicted cobalt transporter CbtA